MGRILHKLAFAAALLWAGPALAEGENTPAAGWYYLWAQCTQEPSTRENPTICESGYEGEFAQAIAVSNVYRIDGETGSQHNAFLAEASRRFGFVLEQANEVGPFTSFAEAEAAIVKALQFGRELNKGLFAVTPVALEPERLDDEPDEEGARSAPSPLPPVMESFKGGSAKLWRDDAAKSCGLRLSDGTEVLPPLVTDTWGEDGDGCPSELVEGSGIFGFDVPRNGRICFDSGVCTYLFDSFGHPLGVIDHPLYPDISPDVLRNWGLIRSGEWNNAIYSIPERRFVFRRWPGEPLRQENRVLVGIHVIVDDRPAIELHREYRARDADFGHFFLDKMRFEAADQ